MSLTAKLIRKYRKKAKLSQSEVAEAIGICVQAISNYETSSAPVPVKHMHDLAMVIGLDLVDLVDAHIADFRKEVMSKI